MSIIDINIKLLLLNLGLLLRYNLEKIEDFFQKKKLYFTLAFKKIENFIFYSET